MAPITPDDHSAYIWAWAIVTFCLSSAAMIGRLILKRDRYDGSDLAFGLAQLMAYGHFGAVVTGLRDGLGKKLDAVPEASRQEMINASAAAFILFILSLAAIKFSMVQALHRIFQSLHEERATKLSRILLVVISIWGLGSTIVVSLGCRTNYILPNAICAACPESGGRLVFVLIFNCLTEIALVGLALYLIVQRLSASKWVFATSVVIFSLRLVLIGFSIADYAARQFAMFGDTTGLAATSVAVWQEVELLFALLTATSTLALYYIRHFDKSCFRPADGSSRTNPTVPNTISAEEWAATYANGSAVWSIEDGVPGPISEKALPILPVPVPPEMKLPKLPVVTVREASSSPPPRSLAEDDDAARMTVHDSPSKYSVSIYSEARDDESRKSTRSLELVEKEEYEKVCANTSRMG